VRAWIGHECRLRDVRLTPSEEAKPSLTIRDIEGPCANFWFAARKEIRRKLRLRSLDAFGPLAAKCVDSSSSSKNFSTMQHTTSDEIFFARAHWYPFPIDDQCVASLHDDHVFIVIMRVRRRFRSVAAGPKCHLTAIFSVKNITFNPRSRLMGSRYPVCRIFHELGKIVHNAHSVTR
jgi:hypothetical protein